MTEVTKSSEGQGKSESEGKTIDVTEIKKRLEELEGTNRRLVEESKENKRKAQDAQKALEDAEKEKIEKSGDLKLQLERERKEKEKLMSDNKSLKGKTLRENIKSAIERNAKDLHDIEEVMNQPKYKDYLERGIDQESLSVSDDAVKEYLNKIREAKPFLFKNLKQENVEGGKPNGGKIDKQSLKNLSNAELDKIIYGE